MPWWWWLIDSVALVVVLGVLLIASLIARRRWITRDGAFDLSVNRRAEHSAQGWMLGIGVYRNDRVEWFRTFSLWLRPRFVLPRGEVIIEGRRTPRSAEAYGLHEGDVIATVQGDVAIAQIALSPSALTALHAWLESSPPGRGVNTVL